MNVTLYRVDTARNMRRYYHLEIAEDLFGCWLLIREWGRIGRRGRSVVASFPSRTAARSAMELVLEAKTRRGYSTVSACLHR
jgi:predicted DNA-binding WGR domain protein